MTILHTGIEEIFHHSADLGIYKFFGLEYPKSMIFPWINACFGGAMGICRKNAFCCPKYRKNLGIFKGFFCICPWAPVTLVFYQEIGRLLGTALGFFCICPILILMYFPLPPKFSLFASVVLRTYDFIGNAPEKENTHFVCAFFCWIHTIELRSIVIARKTARSILICASKPVRY